MERTRDGFRLSTGRTFYAYAHRLSVNLADHVSVLAYGYDGIVEEDGIPIVLTPTERQETAAYMIEQWQRWAAGEHFTPSSS